MRLNKQINKMKHTFPILTLLFAFAISLNSCDTRVNLYADYKDIPIVYGLLDATQDTNYVKIVRAFSNNNENPISATDIALIADSSNYPGKLDARLIEIDRIYGNHYEPTGRVIVLDTMTLHHKDSGAFYYPNQKVYFTRERLKTNSGSHDYKYRLQILKGDDTVTSVTGMVGGDRFKINNSSIGFDPNSTIANKFTFIEAQNAFAYSARMRFEYTEKLPGHPETPKSIEWPLGYFSVNDLELVEGYSDPGHNIYGMAYRENSLFNYLRTAIGADTMNATRYMGDFYITLTAGGSELYNYIEVNSPSGSISQNVPDYTNINGGFGIFSSRVTIKKKVSLSSATVRKLKGVSGWGFEQRD